MDFSRALAAAVGTRGVVLRGLLARSGGIPGAVRVFSGGRDGVPGVFVDVYGRVAVVMVYEGVAPGGMIGQPGRLAEDVLAGTGGLGVGSVYVKRFVRDRSKGVEGELDEAADRHPAAGVEAPEWFLVSEGELKLEVRAWDGLSTGLFLDQRVNRSWALSWCREFLRREKRPARVLNTFAYTCGFSAAAAVGGAKVASVDVSGRYLEWGKRNFGHNGLDPGEPHRFARMDTFEFLGYARRKGMGFDLIVLDPPSFGTGNRRKGIRAWSAVADYARLVREAVGVLAPGGVVLASTNTGELCQPGRLRQEVIRGLGGRTPRWVALPGVGADFEGERGRFATVAFAVG